MGFSQGAIRKLSSVLGPRTAVELERGLSGPPYSVTPDEVLTIGSRVRLGPNWVLSPWGGPPRVTRFGNLVMPRISLVAKPANGAAIDAIWDTPLLILPDEWTSALPSGNGGWGPAPRPPGLGPQAVYAAYTASNGGTPIATPSPPDNLTTLALYNDGLWLNDTFFDSGVYQSGLWLSVGLDGSQFALPREATFS